MKKVTILTLHLGYGGIENAVATLANTLSSKYEVEILSVYRLYKEPVYELNENIRVRYISNIKPNKKEMIYYLNKKNYSMFFKGLAQSIKTGYVKYIKTIFEIRKISSDVIITTRDVHNYLVSKFAKKNIRKIAWEHSHHNDNKKYISRLVNSCKGMNNLVLVSNELAEFYKEYLGNKVIFIPNSIDSKHKDYSKLTEKNLIAVGRLAKEKGFDDLLRLYKKVSLKYPEWKLNIIGDGMQKDYLLDLSKELKLGDKVVFHGFQNKDYINNMLKESSIYIMTSHTESFGIVLIEAMSYGIPCLSYTSAQGANEIIKDNETGYLINNRNEEEMINKICLLIEDEKLRKKMGKNAKEESENYSGEVILDKWSKLLNKRK